MLEIMPLHGCIPVRHRTFARDWELPDFLDRHLGARLEQWTINGSTIWVNDEAAAAFVAFYAV